MLPVLILQKKNVKSVTSPFILFVLKTSRISGEGFCNIKQLPLIKRRNNSNFEFPILPGQSFHISSKYRRNSTGLVIDRNRLSFTFKILRLQIRRSQKN
ncbi:predicted protein [Methanosarcina acetivorans C2A]|uniref:Uncharacterized protein n=1 Tax=Methanosarcina acetivorans (strain ATCC 35395 / DSM 2834 / JCM 12185 / C2A) TaxID=188937 RepID=Q8TIC4_METAC|nr:predicted protein [Methanosarcina acetivorans C2A]